MSLVVRDETRFSSKERKMPNNNLALPPARISVKYLCWLFDLTDKQFNTAFRGCTLTIGENGEQYIPTRDVKEKILLGYATD